jgi:LytS/YehU family sensor histidine kinase
LLGRTTWTTANFGLSGGLALAVYVRFRSARFARETLRAAELERLAASREVLATRLAAMQARVEPQFLLGTLGQVEALYDRDPQGGDRMLDALIVYLRTALPQLRSEGSTLEGEALLVESYLHIVQQRMGSRLTYAVAIGAGLGDNAFPPMLLLPLVDDAICNGLEPLTHGGRIEIGTDIDGDRLRVHVADDGLSRPTLASERADFATLHERLRGLYGDGARLELAANVPHGVVATIEVPLESARADR